MGCEHYAKKHKSKNDNCFFHPRHTKKASFGAPLRGAEPSCRIQTKNKSSNYPKTGIFLKQATLFSVSDHRPKMLKLGAAPKESDRLAVAGVKLSEEAVSESVALPCPLPEGRSVTELPVCAGEPLRNH